MIADPTCARNSEFQNFIYGLGKSEQGRPQLSMRKALRLSICIRFISLLLQLEESVQRFFHRGLLLYPSLVPRKYKLSRPDDEAPEREKTDGADPARKKNI